MFNVINQSGNIAYGIKKYLCDTAADFEELKKKEKATPGSTVFVAETGNSYILNNKGEYITLPQGGGGASTADCYWQFF